MNYPEFGWLSAQAGFPFPVYATFRESGVEAPSQCIVFADAGAISVPGETEADKWQEALATGCSYFRSPSDAEDYPRVDSRTVLQHSKRVDAVFFDGRAEKVRNSAIGFALRRTNNANMWARNYSGPTP